MFRNKKWGYTQHTLVVFVVFVLLIIFGFLIWRMPCVDSGLVIGFCGLVKSIYVGLLVVFFVNFIVLSLVLWRRNIIKKNATPWKVYVLGLLLSGILVVPELLLLVVVIAILG